MLVTDMAGRWKATLAERKQIAAAYEQFVAETDDPHVASFIAHAPIAHQFWLTKDDVYHWAEMRPITAWALAKQEAYWREKGKNGQATAMSIFVLKQPQIGYKDRVDQNITSDGERVTFLNTLPRSKKTEAKRPSNKPAK